MLVLVGIGVLVRLGFWQLERLEQRRIDNDLLAARSTAPLLILDNVKLPDSPENLRHRRAQVTGRFDFERQVILTQQHWQGAPGGHIITPLLIDGSEQAILVDRGWIPASVTEGGDLEPFDVPGVLTITGVIQTTQLLPGGRQTSDDGPRQVWHRIDVEAIQRQLPYALFPVFLMKLPDPGEQSLPYLAEVELDLSEGPHLGYALQWFLFSLLLGGGYLRYASTHK